ncbi:thiolase family protein [Proteiniborus sp. MB09-C3]|uniref:thiolase family protein n=1 Tax=Proteiniborus sp. MB09-C3 TaxID=3050072 RepID=UPI002557A2B1|nr:thiolase family protein [Proteiniborus sp. MB09-C3]WIV12286.1 thiolase family protein [Proteiniborus sp. MB09-C3]
MKDVVIIDSVRTPIGSLGGTLKNIAADILAAETIKELLKRTELNPNKIDEVILGQAKQSADISNIARVASLRAGIPLEVPGYTVHRQCGSGLQVINNATQQIQSENADIVVCGGAESMSTAPYYVNNVRFGVKAGNIELKDPNTASQPGSQPYEVYGDLTMGMTAENVAEKYVISREEQDRFALQSQERARRAINEGRFKDQIVPLIIQQKKNSFSFDTDEYPRDTNMEALGKLKPVFKKEGTVTAGNASGRNDGAAALLIMSKEKAVELGYKNGFRVVAFASAGVDPNYMGLGPIPATKKALEKANLSIEDIDVIELNEAFAAQALAFFREFKLDPTTEKANPNGGAISLGHPIGATGSILMTKLMHELNRIKGKYGVVTLCIAGGIGITTIVERIEIK